MSRNSVTLKSMSLGSCIRFAEGLSGVEPGEPCSIDLSDLGYVTPFGMLWCSFFIRKLQRSHPDLEIAVVGAKPEGYEAHMGFFRAFGVEIGKEPGEAPGSERYLPVTYLDLEKLRAEAQDRLEVAQDTIERRAHQLAALLIQDDDSELYRTLGFTMTEMFRNVLEHSEALQLGYCAQYWPTKDRVEVAILDGGVGVRSALQGNPHLEIEDDEHALHLALLPGVSGRAFAGKRRDPYDHWANSGFGLFMTSNICREGGGFVIASGKASLKLDGEEKSSGPVDMPGTALRLTFRPSKLGAIESRLSELSKTGERLAKEIRGAVPTASGASRMVREQRTLGDP
jgi:hypothetical protein